jgi:hypothetical protein
VYLGIDQQSGLVYEGIDQPALPVVPRAIVAQATLIRHENDWNELPTGIAHSPMSWIFREDTFDPVTRTRRGRLYEALPAQPATYRVLPDPYEDPYGRSVGAGGRTSKSLYAYKACRTLLAERYQGMGMKLALGDRGAASGWRIIQTEIVASGCVMVTLKSLSAFGILPAIDLVKIPEEHRQPVTQPIDRALDAAFRETPISVIDHCRNAMAVLLSRWLVAQGHDRSILGDDLGKVAIEIAKPPYEKGSISRLAQVVARLHARGKTNEAHTKGLRDPIEEDAELTLQALGFALRDIGWAA